RAGRAADDVDAVILQLAHDRRLAGGRGLIVLLHALDAPAHDPAAAVDLVDRDQPADIERRERAREPPGRGPDPADANDLLAARAAQRDAGREPGRRAD